MRNPSKSIRLSGFLRAAYRNSGWIQDNNKQENCKAKETGRMTEAEKLLQETKSAVVAETQTEDICVIDSDLRIASIPEQFKILGVEHDKDVRVIQFKLPKMYKDLDLSAFTISVNFLNAKNEKGRYLVTDKSVSGDQICFSWSVGNIAVRYKGNTRFIVCMRLTGSDGEIQKEFNTTLATMTVLEGLEVDNPVIEQGEKDIVAQLLQIVDEKSKEAVNAVKNAGTAQKTAVEGAGTQAVENVENAQQAATEAVGAAKTAAVQEVQAEGVKQAEVLQGAVQEIVEDREQIQANKESIDNIKKDLESKEAAITLDHFDLISSLHAQDGLLSGYTSDFDADISSSKSEYVVYSIHLTTAGLDNLSCKTPGAANIGNALYYTDFTNKSKEIVSAKNLNENFSNNYVTHASGEDNFEIDIAKLIKNGYKKLYICYNKTDNGYIYSSNMKPKWLYDFSADIEKLKESILGDESGTALVIRKVKSPSIYTVIHNQSSTALENGKTYFVSATIDSDVSNGKITLNSSGSSTSVVYTLAEGAINKGTHNYMFTHDSSQYNELYVRIFLDGNSEKCSLLEIIDPAGNSVEKQISRKVDYMYCTVSIFNSVGAIGDSYTAGSTKHSDSTWTAEREHSYIATMAKRAGISWSNYGVPGAHTRSYLTAADGMKKVLATSANDFYFLALGINDVNALGLSYLGIEDDISSGADTFFGNYAKIINQLKGHAPNAKLCMIKPPFKDGDYPQFRDAVEKIAKHYDIPFIDPFNDPAFTNVIYTTMSDGHPTLAGYNAMGLAYERLFSKMVEDNVEYFRYATVG
ncbi:MAG: hypothetical protein DBY32_08565 [Phascolarctobacterium sp.]|nr:MAG: hypothetical protein DBY32_08565 [Phascolarctobacterium sp.]